MNPTPYTAGPAAPPRAQQPAHAAGAESVVDQNSDFNGRYTTSNNLRIEGQAQGEIKCAGTLFITEGGRVQASVEARDVTIAGEFKGDVTCDGRFVLLPTARAHGRIRTAAIVVQEGAIFAGEIRMADPSAAAAPAPRPTGSATRTRAASPSSNSSAPLASLLDEAPASSRTQAGAASD